MKKVNLSTKCYCHTTCVYDDKEFKIEYNKANDSILLSRVKDGVVVKIFGSNLGFIEQVNNEDSTLFIVSDYSKKYDNCKNRFDIELGVYVLSTDYTCGYHLTKLSSYEINSSDYNKIHLTDKSYLVNQKGYSGCIFSAYLDKTSPSFEKVFDYSMTSKKRKDVVFVEQLIESQADEVNDRIVFGIDPETFEIKTSIYSFNQDRYIELYSEEEVEKAQKIECSRSYLFDNKDLDVIGRTTINYEVRVPLFNEADLFRKKDICDGNMLNQSFIKKLSTFSKED